MSVYFGLGSNQGNRRENIEAALSRMDQAFGTHYSALSGIIETPAWGFGGEKFLNACVRYRLIRRGTASEHAKSLLCACKEIERALGRKEEALYGEDGARIYHDRPIDIDILFYGTEQIETESLTIPHPRIAERDFVKIPLREIAKPPLRAAFPGLFD